MNHNDIRGVANNWLSSYLQSRFQYGTTNNFSSNFEQIPCDVPQGSTLGSLLFLIYINDPRCGIKYCSVHQFSGDIHLLDYNNSVKRMNKDESNKLVNGNKTCLNISKTEFILFKSARKETRSFKTEI